jgi:hypothetical protein
MTTRVLFLRFKQLPDDALEREGRKVMLQVMLPRLVLGLVALLAWTFLRGNYIDLEPKTLDWLVGRVGSAIIIVASIYPLIRVMTMDDAEMDERLR